jgi:hypothetical protein
VKILHGALEQALQDLPNKFLLELVAKKLSLKGIKLSTRDRKRLAKRLSKGIFGTFRVGNFNFWDHRHLKIEFTPEEIEQAGQKSTEFIEGRLPEVILASADDLSQKILADLKRRWPAEARRQRQQSAGFSKRLHERWKAPIEGLKMLLTISREFGARMNEEIRASKELRSRKHLVEVLTRSHARACQITEEVICLLNSGFADGAMARWRTLHEIAVVASFVGAHGEDLAERYLLHQNVESKRAADDYEKFRVRLGRKPLDAEEIKKLEGAFAALGRRYGSEFLTPHGWAAHHLQIRKPTFRHIEQAAKIDHLRPYYRMASHPVHASSKGVFFQLGLLRESQILLSGPSNAGLVDPGHSTAISLAQIAAALGDLQPTLDNIVALKMILQLVDEIGEAFAKAQTKLENDTARLGSSVQMC